MRKIVVSLALACVVLVASGSVALAQLQGPLISVNPTSYDFGQAPLYTVTSFVLTVYNTGDAPLTVYSVKTRAPFIDSVSAPFIIAPGGHAKINVGFAPTQVGVFSGVVTLDTNAWNTPVVNVPLTGEGID
jgi:hypothetical protein